MYLLPGSCQLPAPVLLVPTSSQGSMKLTAGLFPGHGDCPQSILPTQVGSLCCPEQKRCLQDLGKAEAKPPNQFAFR